MKLPLALVLLVLTSLIVATLISLVVTDDAQEEGGSDRNQLRGQGRGGIFRRNWNDAGGDDEEDVSVIVRCAPFTEKKCFDDLQAVTDGPPIKIVINWKDPTFLLLR